MRRKKIGVGVNLSKTRENKNAQNGKSYAKFGKSLKGEKAMDRAFPVGSVTGFSRDLAAHLFCFRAAALGFDELRFRSPRTLGFSPAFAGSLGQLRQFLSLGGFVNFPKQPPPRRLSVHRLRARIRNCHTQTRGNMTQGDGGRDLVHMLPAGPARA